jgi:L,D-peptidoglycan transpeptidase YkuD (ErfK/YbiS/YcfS/YnhG family)
MRLMRYQIIVVRRAPGRPSEGRLILPEGVRRAALGRSGIKALKREGDGATPLGRFVIREVLYRADRAPRPRTGLPCRAIRKDDGWSDDPCDRNYNRHVRLPSRRSGEGLMRADNLYDLIIVLGYNDWPRIRGNGSAIFTHLVRPGYTPTEGCIALSRRDMHALLRRLRPGTTIEIKR